MVLKRIRDMFVASVHEGLDKMENPKVMLNQYVRDMESDIAKAKQTIVKQHTIAYQFKKNMKKPLKWLANGKIRHSSHLTQVKKNWRKRR